MLAARSPVLAAMFRHTAFQEGQTAKVRLVDVDVETFKQYLHLLYTGSLVRKPANHGRATLLASSVRCVSFPLLENGSMRV